jgi:hypothetical protein
LSESSPSHPLRGELISDHHSPRPWQRGLTAILVVLGLAGILIAVIGLLALSLIYGLLLLPLMAIFLLALVPPLLLPTVLHPRVTVFERGLWIMPVLWSGCWVDWEHITRVTDHTLIRRGTTKRGQIEHFGRLIVVDRGLSLPFLVVGIMAGLGRVRAFGISTLGQTEYERLRDTIERTHPQDG